MEKNVKDIKSFKVALSFTINWFPKKAWEISSHMV